MKKGFTLIELLVVVAIIGMLSSVVLAALGDARASARDSRRIQDLKQIQTALELYRQENDNTYPVCSNEYINDQTACLAVALTPRYMSSVPVDPFMGVMVQMSGEAIINTQAMGVPITYVQHLKKLHSYKHMHTLEDSVQMGSTLVQA